MGNLILDRVAFTLFGLDVYWYGLIITLAIVLDFVVLLYVCKKCGYDKDIPFDLVLAVVLPGIIGARLFSVIFDPDSTILNFFEFRNGGMSIVGALIGGACGIGIYTYIKKYNYFFITDMLVPLVLLSQGIGRWGNYFNKEVYGQLITNPSQMWFPFAVEIRGNWYQALFFYESVLNIIGAIALIIIYYKLKEKKGLTTGSYLIYYGVIRFILESFRQDEFILRLGTLPISKIMSAVMVLAGITIIVFRILIDKQVIKRNKNERIENKNE